MQIKNTMWGKYTMVTALMVLSLVMSMMLVLSVNAQEATDTPPPPPQESTPPAEPTPPPQDPAPVAQQVVVEPTPEPTPVQEPTPETAPAGNAEVSTGDALATSGASNEANTNTASVPEAASTTVSNTNEAAVGNSADAAAATGDNNAQSSGGSASVTTGDAVAAANVINVVNTNVVNSPGILAFLNFLFGGGFDFRNFDLSYFLGGSAPQSGCSLSSCDNGGSLTVTNSNDATVTNTVLVRSSTGGNTASSSGDGSAGVATGDAYASANVFNLVNTNFINSNYLLVSFNNFGDMAGDITLPGADFFSQLLARNSLLPGSTTINNDNTASVTNSTSANADTGGNSAGASGSGDASITTGDAYASATTYNQVNTNLVGGTRVFMLINVVGDWSGSVFGLPPGMAWARTPTGVVLMNEESEGGGAGSSTPSGLSALLNSNTNKAVLNNDVQVWALTGENKAQGGEGGANVSTGNAYASANVVNIVNTNVIGQNWLFAIFNIFGNWKGNLSFGRPDLWIGAVAEASNPAQIGETVSYRFTVSNKGDADARNVVLKGIFDKNLLTFSTGDQQNADGNVWHLGNIPRGATKEFTYSATVGIVPRGGIVEAPLTAVVSSDDTDNDDADNTERLSIFVSDPHTTVLGTAARGAWTGEPNVTITKTASVSTTTLPASVDYKIVVHNSGAEAYSAELTDTLVDPSGEEIYSRSWDLETIAPNDEISLSYTVNYDVYIDPGVYTNTAKITGQKGNSASAYAVNMKSVETSVQIELEASGEIPGEVLGAQTESLPLQCAAYITSFIKPGGKNNNNQVRRLQFFLRDFENLHVVPNGTYDEATIAAVKSFQKKYKDEILAPWGDTNPSGFVYYTTQRKINELYCQGNAEFKLSSSQMQRILAYRAGSNDFEWVSVSDAPEIFSSPIEFPQFFSPSPAAAVPLATEQKAPGFLSIFQIFFAQLLSLHLDIEEAQAQGL